MKNLRRAVLASLVVCAGACVPADTKAVPPRGGVVATLAATMPYPHTFPTFDDGWQVTLESVIAVPVLIIGSDRFSDRSSSDDACATNGGPDESALQIVRPNAGGTLIQRGVLGGEVECYASVQPTVWISDGSFKNLGPGVTLDDLGVVAQPRGRDETSLRAVRIVGSARRGSRSLRFDVYANPSGAFFDQGVEDSESRIAFKVRPNDKIDLSYAWDDLCMFRSNATPDAAPQFAAWALADDSGDEDGTVTNDELDNVYTSAVDFDDAYDVTVAPGRWGMGPAGSPSYQGTVAGYVSLMVARGWRIVR